VTERLRLRFPNVEVRHFHVVNPFDDLVRMRNSQLGFPEKWGFIVDSDEYHQDIASYAFETAASYALQSWAVWKPHFAHKASCRAVIGRVFRNSRDIHWRGSFNKEVLYNGRKSIFEGAELLPYRYIHFTHVKKENWRKELGKERIADGRELTRVPAHVWDHVRRLEEEMQIVPRWHADAGTRYGNESAGELTHRKGGQGETAAALPAQGGAL